MTYKRSRETNRRRCTTKKSLVSKHLQSNLGPLGEHEHIKQPWGSTIKLTCKKMEIKDKHVVGSPLGDHRPPNLDHREKKDKL